MIVEKMLRNVRRTTIIISVLLVLVMIIFPPYFGTDLKSEGRGHTNLGYFPLWAKPGESDAYQGLVRSGMVLERDSTRDITQIEPGRYTAHLNKVHMAANVLLVMFVNVMMLIIISMISKRL